MKTLIRNHPTLEAPPMPNLTIKNLPRVVHQRLKKQAVRHRRSLNQEIVEILSREAEPIPVDTKTFFRELDALHRKFKIPPVNEEDLANRREGLL